MAGRATLFRPTGPNTLAQAYRGRDVAYRGSLDSSNYTSSVAPSESASHYGHEAPSPPFIGVLRNEEMLGRKAEKSSAPQLMAHQNSKLSDSGVHLPTQDLSLTTDGGDSRDGSRQNALTATPSSDPTLDTSSVSQPTGRLRRSRRFSEQSLRSYDSDSTSTVAATTPQDEVARYSIRNSSASVDRLTEKPRKNNRLFEYIDWDGVPRKTPVKRAPPVSFNRWVQNKPDVAFTSVVMGERARDGIGATGNHGDMTANLTKTRVGVSGRRLLDASLNDSKSKTLSDSDFKKPKESEVQPKRETRSVARPPTATFIEPTGPEPFSTAPPPLFYKDWDTPVSDHKRSESDFTNDSIPSVTTSKLPNVTHPGMRAYYAQFLPASTLTNSSTTTSSSAKRPTSDSANQHLTPPPRRAEFLANHNNIPLSLFPPYANKPLPPLPTPHGPAVAASEWAVASMAQLEQSAFEFEKLRTNALELERVMLDTISVDASSCRGGQYHPHQPVPHEQQGVYDVVESSRFSNSDSDEDDADCEVREIDQKMFGRAKYIHMRPGTEGWEEYKEKMLQESKGKRKGKPSGKAKHLKQSWLGKRLRGLSYSHT